MTCHFKFFLQLFSLSLILALGACGGGSSSGIPTSGNSNVGAPSSILNKTLVETVTRSGYVPSTPGSTIVITQPGESITYSFIDANTILGEGVRVVPTISWSYSLNGNVATLNQVLQYGQTTDVLTFNSPTGGTFRSDGRLTSGTTFFFEGTFTVSPYASGSGSSSGSGTGSSSSSSSTGRVAFWTSNTQNGYIDVNVDGGYAGTLTSYYNSTPTCGDTGTITRTLSVGVHSFSASSSSRVTWGPGNFNVTAGGCLTYELQ